MKLLRASVGLTVLLLCATLIGDSADAGRKKRDKKKKSDQTTEVAPPPPPPRTKPVPLFKMPLPVSIGKVPNGLANSTAQGCGACHFGVHAGWSQSAHANGWKSDTLQAAVATAASPACMNCHLPLLVQRPELVTYDTGDINKPLTAPNPAFQASLRLEGVTCAVCHIRDGAVIGPRPPEQVARAPHPLKWSPELTKSEGCATCHQLQWPGSNQPFYNTYGEWKRSPQARAGVQCQDCHGGGGAAGDSFNHTMPARRGTAVSLLLDIPTLTLIRGGDPLPVGLVLQNTGAGHSFPTGTPFRGVQLIAQLIGPPDKTGKPITTEAYTYELKRTVSNGPPWDLIKDTTLGAGAELRLDTTMSLDHNAPIGPWVLDVRLIRTQAQATEEPPILHQRLPLLVE